MSECKRCGAPGCAHCGLPHDTFVGPGQRCLSRFDTVRYEYWHDAGETFGDGKTGWNVLKVYELHAKQRDDGAWDAFLYSPDFSHIPMLETGWYGPSGILPTRARAEAFARAAVETQHRLDHEHEAAAR